MKTKDGNRLDAEDGMRCALSSTSPRTKIEALVNKFQQQISHSYISRINILLRINTLLWNVVLCVREISYWATDYTSYENGPRDEKG